MSQPESRETVIVPIEYGHNRTKIEVYYKDPDKPERQAQLSSGMTEAKIRLAAGAKLEECMILVKQITPDGSEYGAKVLCDGKLEPYDAELHKLGSCCGHETEPEPEVEYEPIDEVFEEEDDIEDELLAEDEDDNGVQDEEAEEPTEDEYKGWGEEVDEEVDEEQVTDDDEDNETVDEDTPST